MRDLVHQPVTASITIAAPIERVFALSTRVELVQQTLGMKLVESALPNAVTAGHIAAHSRVVWRGWKFGLPTEHHTLITAFAAPERQPTGEVTAFFQDSQERGRFAFFQHDHHFREAYDPASQQPLTTLYDEIRFALPCGALGRLAANLLLAPHIRSLARRRFAMIQQLAESDGWRMWVDETPLHARASQHPEVPR
jgi:ligand-binding SRPBCC domain-containing protein